ncbi:Lysophospholipase L1 [Chitinophaga sp. CF118]|uniref:SGNH/GDSL hydrolase family protein n=1 Tax=Chitinophaga sp. CF118 TaxID=1884367 RepID=UPI0008F35B35|nr:SGNH/GDSL hydrolase family protein [Chitinophaga sp. CF118]SFD90004.1 Lysophospholipase L1 [Chitinophaga sp. CF118]
MHRRSFLQTGLLTTSLAFQEKYFPAKKGFSGSSEIVNAGIGGNNTADLLKRIDTDCLALHPDLTILMIGTNDMNSRKYIPLTAYEKNLREIVSKIRGINSQVLLMSILPAYEPYLYTRHPQSFYAPEGHSGRKQKVNEVIKKVAEDYRQSFLDMDHIFQRIGNVGTGPDSLIQNEANSKKTDGIHPTPEGYRTMAVAIFEYLTERQLPLNRIVCFGDSITLGDGGTEGKSYPAYLKRLL